MKGLSEQEVVGLKSVIRGAAHIVIGIGRHIKNGESDTSSRLIEDGIDEVIKGCETISDAP